MSEQVKLKSVLNSILNNNIHITYEQRTAILEYVKKEASTEGKPSTNARIYINWMECALQHWQSEGPGTDILIFFIDVLYELTLGMRATYFYVFCRLSLERGSRKNTYLVNQIKYFIDVNMLKTFTQVNDEIVKQFVSCRRSIPACQVLSKNKNIFILLHQDNIFKRIIYIIEYLNFTQEDITKKYIKLLDSFTHADFGRHWIVSSWDSWKSVFKVIPSRTYTEDLSVFLKNLFLNVVDSNEIFSMDIWNLIQQPLNSVYFRVSENDIQGFVEEDLQIEIIPTMDLLSSVVMCISEHVTLDNQWFNHCDNLLSLQQPLINILETVKGEQLTLELSKLLGAIHFLELNKYSKKPYEFIDLFSMNILKILDLNTDRQFIDNITVFSYHMQHYWFHIRRLLHVEQLNLPYDLGVGLCLYQTTGVYGICFKILGKTIISTLEEDDLREEFVREYMSKVSKPILKYLFKAREILLKINCFILEAHLSMTFIIKSLDLYNKDGQIMIFNIMLYVIGDIVKDIVDRGGITSDYYDGILVTDFIKTFVIFADKCDITWKDVTNHMLVLVTVTDLLQVQDLPFDVIIAALKLLDLAINKDMDPNLILLTDSSSESIGELLLKYLNHENVEVRCATSNVLVTISKSSKSKYPLSQNLILELNMCQLLMENFFSNEVVEVRSNSLKCFQHLVRIDAIWDDFIAIPEILVTIINSLKIETENLLRAELVNLVIAIYEQDHFTDLQIENVYEIMTRFGVHDFDVAVRINTLKFWDIVIKKLLIDEGMIDNEFPEMTFSKTAKKIVILDQDEVQRRLRRFMMKLSNVGCLTVLNACFNSKEKSEKQFAYKIVTNLLTLLEKYDIDEDNVDLSLNLNYRKNNLNISEPEILSPTNFLENITEQLDNSSNEDVSVRNFAVILDEILSQNNLDDLDTINSYLGFNKNLICYGGVFFYIFTIK